MTAYLRGIQFYLPAGVRTNEELVAANPGWSAEAIYAKTGIRARHITSAGETAADLGHAAAEGLLDEVGLNRGDIDVLLFCTQSPDYFLPSTACLLQDRLGLPVSCGALDYNLGCSGFTYGLWLARALVHSESARNVLLVVADTYSKYCDPHDLATVTIFGDAGAAALISASPEQCVARLGPTVVGTDGRGGANLIVRGGCARLPQSAAPQDRHLFMNGPEIFSFTLTSVKAGIDRLLDQVGLEWEEVDWFLFHQANRFMLDRLRSIMRIPESKLPVDMEDVGNTVSASIPLLMRRRMDQGCFQPGQRCVLAGFGVGYSWAMTELTWGAD
ncbi:MAG: 3-oxoacyl-ACP synthase III family protein [Phycisphaerae bacterium]